MAITLDRGLEIAQEHLHLARRASKQAPRRSVEGDDEIAAALAAVNAARMWFQDMALSDDLVDWESFL